MTKNFASFVQTIARLRGPDGCPWAREQTHRSLARFLLEETYEVLEAIHEDNPDKLQEELGDLLLQIVLNAQLAKESGHFDIDEVAAGINAKMIRRHPHVFGNAKADDSDAVLKQWDDLKEDEKKAKSDQSSILDGIARTLPALMQSLKISEKVVSQGFEWDEEGQIWQQLDSEIAELKEALHLAWFDKKDKSAKEFREAQLEIGDVLFTVVNIARWHDMNPEECLILANEKFKSRFGKVEKLAKKPLKKLTFDEYEELLQQAKALDKLDEKIS